MPQALNKFELLPTVPVRSLRLLFPDINMCLSAPNTDLSIPFQLDGIDWTVTETSGGAGAEELDILVSSGQSSVANDSTVFDLEHALIREFRMETNLG